MISWIEARSYIFEKLIDAVLILFIMIVVIDFHFKATVVFILKFGYIHFHPLFLQTIRVGTINVEFQLMIHPPHFRLIGLTT